MWSNLSAPEVGGGSNDEGCDPCYPHNSPPPRADVADHRVVNHTLGDMDTMMRNPFKPGEQIIRPCKKEEQDCCVYNDISWLGSIIKKGILAVQAAPICGFVHYACLSLKKQFRNRILLLLVYSVRTIQELRNPLRRMEGGRQKLKMKPKMVTYLQK